MRLEIDVEYGWEYDRDGDPFKSAKVVFFEVEEGTYLGELNIESLFNALEFLKEEPS